jgi:ribonuclease P protein component
MPTFNRQERLKSAKAIAALFKGGQSFVSYPIRVVWDIAPAHLLEGSEHRCQVAFAVPKRRFKTAVQRNRIKRQMREAFRLQKSLLHDKLLTADKKVVILLSYIAQEPLPFADISGGVAKMIRKLPV